VDVATKVAAIQGQCQ